MTSDTAPLSDAKQAADFVKATLDEISKTLVYPVPIILSLISILASKSESAILIGLNVNKGWSIMIGFLAIFLFLSHCVRLLSSLSSIVSINNSEPVKTMLRFHPGLFNPCIIAWPKISGGSLPWMAYIGISLVVLTGRFGLFFVFALSAGLSLGIPVGLDDLSIGGFIVRIALLIIPIVLCVMARGKLKELDSHIQQPHVPQETWQSRLGITLGYLTGFAIGLLVVA